MSKSSESKTESMSGKPSGQNPPTEESTTWLQLLFRIFLVLLTLFLILCVVGYFMPRDYSVESSITIDATPDEIYPLLVNLDRWKEWSPAWDFEANSHFASHHFGADRRSVTWRHVHRGVTSIWISKTVTNESITMGHEDAAYPNRSMVSRIELSQDSDGKTIVRWSSDTKLPNKPIVSRVLHGWGGTVFAGGLEQVYKKDLERLKKVFEAEEN